MTSALVVDAELLGLHTNQVVLHLPVAERPEDLVGDEDRAGRGFGQALRVEGDEPQLSLRVAHGEAGRERRPPSRARSTTGRAPARRPASGPRTASSIESGRAPIRLVNQFESGTSSMVLTFRAFTSVRRIAGAAEEVLRQVPEQIDVPRLHLRGVLRLGLARKRIVGVEPDGRAARRGRRAGGRRRRERRAREARGRWRVGHDAAAASEGGAAGEHEVKPVAPVRQLDAQRRRERAVEADADADVALQAFRLRSSQWLATLPMS